MDGHSMRVVHWKAAVCTGGDYSWFVGLARAIYIRCIYGNSGREITKYTVIFSTYMVLVNLLVFQQGR
jgi:hypothetical protein